MVLNLIVTSMISIQNDEYIERFTNLDENA